MTWMAARSYTSMSINNNLLAKLPVWQGFSGRNRTRERLPSNVLWLERACDEHSGHVVFLKVEAEWDPLRQDPRFADLVQRIGL